MILPDCFDPDGTGVDNGNYFGLPFTPEESELVLLSVPWDVTASYGGGAVYAPDAIIGASTQLDLYDPLAPQMWRRGIGTIGIDYTFQEKSVRLREDAVKVMAHLVAGGKVTDDHVRRKIEMVNAASEELDRYVYNESCHWLGLGKTVGLVGGDHSTPFGLIRALAEREERIGILHIDAHRDLRQAYEGFNSSHASIMYNVMTQVAGIEKLVQVGVRDYCDAENEMAACDGRIASFSDDDIAEALFAGKNWHDICGEITAMLPEKVYISFDIDGLDPSNAPHTGTPVPGGLSFNQAVWLVKHIAASGRRIVGFDLCEVSPSPDSEWDANVGARMLFKLCNQTLKSK